jgi:hypothetical protein
VTDVRVLPHQLLDTCARIGRDAGPNSLVKIIVHTFRVRADANGRRGSIATQPDDALHQHCDHKQSFKKHFPALD